nr:immunoglobulin light chain junction region [Macaca mulatta]
CATWDDSPSGYIF